MSTSLNPLFFLCLVFAVLVAPALAGTSQDAVGVINGDNNKQVVGNEINTHIDKQFVKKDVNAPTYIDITNEAPVDTSVQVDGLDVGTVDESVLVFKDEVISYPVQDNQTYYIRSGAPIAVYTIATGNDRILLSSSESVLTYDPIYHRFVHGIISPLQIFPKYTEKCSMTASAPGYIVIDNRFSGVNTMIEISPSPF
jgi:hypothetical protein